jgi:hypothetical protein
MVIDDFSLLVSSSSSLIVSKVCESMYIRKASRTVHGKTYFNYLLVESHLTPKGPRQKVICSLGDLSPRPKEQWLELARKLENALTGQQDLFASASPDRNWIRSSPR